MDALWCEDLLDYSGVEAFAGKIDEYVLAGPRAARSATKRVVESMSERGCEAVQGMVRSKKASWFALDSDYLFEVAIMETLSGPGSEKRLIDKMLSVFPDASKEVSIDDAIVQIDAVRSSASFSLATVTAQAKHSLVRTLLGRIKDTRPPGVSDLAQDASMSPVVSRLVYFMRAQDKKKTALFGCSAITQVLETCEAKLKKVELNVEDVKPLRIWSYLMSTEKQASANTLLQTFDKAKKGQVLRKDAGGGKKGKKPTEDVAMSEALAMFGTS